MATKRLDLTTGNPMKQILLFSLPLVMGSLFQQLYSFVDTIMVGRLISNDALAAVGSVSSLIFLVLGFVAGTCSGFSIPLAKPWVQKIRKSSRTISGTAAGSV